MNRMLLYSDLRPGISDAVDDCLMNQLKGTRCKIGYIPSDSDMKRRYFAKIQDQYLKLGISDVTYFDLGLEYDPQAIKPLLACDAIHLSGGDPFSFLTWVKKREFTSQLKLYLKQGGLLIGVSAGAMILSKSLGLAEEDWMTDKNRPIKHRIKGLNFFDFEFFPHFKQDFKTATALANYKKNHQTQVFACDDDAGIFIQDDQIQLLGSVYKI